MNGEGRIESVAYVKELDQALAPAGTDVMRVAEDFFGLADVVATNSQLRRALTDPGRDSADKQALVAGAFSSHLAPATLSVLDVMVADHWSNPSDLKNSLEVLGILAVLTDAQRADMIVTVEHELMNLIEVLTDHRELRQRLSDMKEYSSRERADLASTVFSSHVSPWTMRLLRRGVGRSRHGRLLHNLRRFARWAATLRDRLLVTVETATQLSAAQVDRLREILTKRFGKELSLALSVNPDVVGGFRIVSGATSVDASLATRLADLQRRLAR
ncbi:F0F1 ATP synthase subunit delta [Schaalia sp. ZJ405]|uniref:F0F1 ATP synthase subunit delta n=1 Tax=Schaalia sp. ZJ405 TaxID=2709403 RepID=UPI0013EA7DE9|nr:F0F1 ATP synthase subunit delta [Schaalia sp. ZJ405]QPK80617.1 F0F1 ATP synthase subunit delta [Schaalia sp. ZJ405]